MNADTSAAATHDALRTAAACTLCLVLAEWWQLQHANLAVWTAYMVMAQHAFSSFQKGVERIVGRGLGILAGLLLTTVADGAPLLCLVLLALVLVVCFYVYFADRLAYTFLNAGLYAVALFEIAHAHPLTAVAQAQALFGAVVLGVVGADAVTWLTGAERALSLQVGSAPLWPIRRDWMSHSLMLAVTVIVTLFAAHLLELPAEQAAVSVMMLTIAPDIQALLHKGELRIAGALLATLWALATFTLIALVPAFLLLAGLLFLGQYLAAYLARTGGPRAYAGVQMGLVLPMMLVAPPSELGTLSGAGQRCAGILIALAAALVIGGLWPAVAPRQR